MRVAVNEPGIDSSVAGIENRSGILRPEIGFYLQKTGGRSDKRDLPVAVGGDTESSAFEYRITLL